MSDKEKDWNVFYCKNEDAGQREDKSQSADIPVSKRLPGQNETPYTNDYSADASEEDMYRSDFSRFWMKNKRRNLRLLIVAILLLVFAAVIAFILIVDQKLDLIDYNPGINFENADQTNPEDYEEDLVFTPMHDVADASSLKDWLQQWAQNGGQKLHSKNVINCLLCGVDTQEGTSGRTDAMILVSLNKKNKTITLTSFMRDSYTYMDIDGRDRWYKINSAYNWGGAATLVETIENNYKIEIDNYITVDFNTFPKLIDALGGVEIEVEEYEAKYIRRTSSHKKFPYGESVRLNGEQALIYSRIRKSDADGDLARTRRQRKVVTALISMARKASAGQLNNMLNLVLPYVQTNYRRAQVLSLSTQAMLQGWMHYEILQVSCPLLEGMDMGDATQITGKDSFMMTGYARQQEFVWIVDYQLDAQRVQQALYGMTNIEVNTEDYVSPFDFLKGSSRSSDDTDRSYYSYRTTTRSYYNYDTPEEEEPQPENEPTTRFIDRLINPFRDGESTTSQQTTAAQQPTPPSDNEGEEEPQNGLFEQPPEDTEE